MYCYSEGCNIRDNLPFMCHECKNYYCRKHISNHICINKYKNTKYKSVFDLKND